MSFEMEKVWWKLKHDLYRSREYYGTLQVRFEVFLWGTRIVEALMAYAVYRVADLNTTFFRLLIIIGIVFSSLKGELSFSHRAKSLKKQYREAGRLLNELEIEEVQQTEGAFSRLKRDYATMESSDHPTIPCLDAVCWNVASRMLGSNERYNLSLFQKTVGTWLPFVSVGEDQRVGGDGNEA